MWKRFARWAVRYSPTFVLIAEMALAYWALLYLLFHVVWPYAYLNAEPVQAGLTAAANRMAERAKYRVLCQNALTLMGVAALALYMIYTANGLLRMSHEAHVKFSRQFRRATHSCYLVLMVNVCANYFVLSWANTGLDWVKIGLTVLGLVSYVWFLFAMACSYLKNQADGRYKSAGMPLLSIVASCLLATMLKVFDGVGLILRDVGYAMVHSSLPTITAAANRYLLTQPVDYLLPAALLFLWLMLFLAMKFASPVAACTPKGGGIYAMVMSDRDRR